ncbi:Spc97/Spc98 family protein (macronuclear) [Tetrahymena thermophila SB210]|uniref:Spindle pole body component n=1 Tax=Tetrahymena thermophila (strain SB210) TaxID=312017 RepID=Q23AE3_TETTS|nr:Spc97/Spc98 family protein [Tetrahymena thermophila SB210]EAR93549.3 Spc97/Spc98 family protein [Tetrahymena thermophila SB210]|eukprot:XP_001013794.3 Spc97/Spc98 family protein [Tetrahymena thermophila SB210]
MIQENGTGLSYLTKIGIKNTRNNRYLSHQYTYDTEKNELTGNSVQMSAIHPFLKQQTQVQETDSIEEFIIYNSQNQDYPGFILFGSQVHIKNSQGYYLLCQADGSLKMEKPEYEENFQNGITFKSAKWTLVDANNQQSKRQIHVYEEIAFKSPYGNYLICENLNTVSANSPNISPDSMWRICKSHIPFMPTWTEPTDFSSFLTATNTQIAYQEKQQLLNKTQEKKNLGAMSPQLQELYLIEDLLFVMTGIEGNYIKKKADQYRKPYIYCIEPYLETSTCESSLKQLVNKILEICLQYDKIQNYIAQHQQFSFGTVSQALCAALGLLLREYVVMINQLDQEFQKAELTLQKLWFYIQPSLKVMEALYKLVSETENYKGGELLSKLYDLLKNTSDKQIVDIYYYVLQKSFAPYVQMLSQWIYYGQIDDLFQEFFIQENVFVKRDNISKDFKENYWDQRFILREKQVPAFLYLWKEMVFKTGKYLSVLSEHEGKVVSSPFELDLVQNYETYLQMQDFSQPIQKAYEWANAQIMHLVVVDQDLQGRLKSIKNYFFLERGDFFVYFLDSSEEELIKQARQVSKEKLESLLEMSIRTSSLSSDPYVEDLTYEFSQYTLKEQLFAYQNSQMNPNLLNDQNQEKFKIHTPALTLKGLDLFSLDYRIKWPLNLIFNRKTLTKYQLIFRHLFNCKYIERQLSNAWLVQQSMKELNVQRIFLKGYALTQRMIHYVKNFIYYICFEVIETKWQKLKSNLKSVQQFEDIIQHHDQFLDECLKECVLLDTSLINTIQSINSCCQTFAQFIQNNISIIKKPESQNTAHLLNQDEKKTPLQQRKEQVEEQRKHARILVAEKNYKDFFQKYTQKFDSSLKDLMKIINNMITKYDTYLINLIARLDFDGFYSNQWSFNQGAMEGQNQFFENNNNDKNQSYQMFQKKI